MNKSILFLLFIVAVFFASCIPTKDLIYLQDKGGNDSLNTIKPIVSKPYRLQINDVISINIKANDASLVGIFKNNATETTAQGEQSLYFEGYTIDDHGNIRIPILGEVNVIGYTLDEARKKIEDKLLDEYFNKEANIFVIVKLAGLRYTVNGEVGSPGSKLIFQDKLTILEAIANSGDITITGNRKKVTVIRQFPYGTEMHDIDLTDSRAMDSPYYYVKPNDYIYVKPLPQKSFGTGTTGLQSLTTIISILSLLTTTALLIRNN